MKTKSKNCVVAAAATAAGRVGVGVGTRAGEKMKSVILYPYGPLTGAGCCRMLHAKNLAITSAIYTINISLLIVLIYCWRINVNIRKSGDLEDVYYGVQIAYFAIIGTQMSMIVLSVMLIFGIYRIADSFPIRAPKILNVIQGGLTVQENPGLIVPWIIGYITFMALEAVAMVYSNVLRDHVNKQFDAMCKAEVAFFIARAFINVLAMWGVLRFYNLVRSGITWKGPEVIELKYNANDSQQVETRCLTSCQTYQPISSYYPPQAKTALTAATTRISTRTTAAAANTAATAASMVGYRRGVSSVRYCTRHRYRREVYTERRTTGCCAFLDFDDYDDDDDDCDVNGDYDYDDYYYDDDDDEDDEAGVSGCYANDGELNLDDDDDEDDDDGDGSDCAMLGRGGRGGVGGIGRVKRARRHFMLSGNNSGNISASGSAAGGSRRQRQRSGRNNNIRSVLINKRHHKYKIAQPQTRLEVINESERSAGSGSDENDSLLVAYDSTSSLASV